MTIKIGKPQDMFGGKVKMIDAKDVVKQTVLVDKTPAQIEEQKKIEEVVENKTTTPLVDKEPSFYEKNKNMIFIGAGIGAVVIIGAVVYFKTRKTTA